MQPILKIAISAILIFVVAELAKRSSFFGALIASLPLVSIIAMIWLWRELPLAALAMACVIAWDVMRGRFGGSAEAIHVGDEALEKLWPSRSMTESITRHVV